jgi:hypothetical protein
MGVIIKTNNRRSGSCFRARAPGHEGALLVSQRAVRKGCAQRGRFVQLLLSVARPMAPWLLVPPTHVVHYVAGRDELQRLSVLSDVTLQHLQQLVGEQQATFTKKDGGALKRSAVKTRSGWVLLSKVRWLQRVDTKELVPVGGDVDFFVKRGAGISWLRSAASRPEALNARGSRPGELCIERSIVLRAVVLARALASAATGSVGGYTRVRRPVKHMPRINYLLG